MRSLYLLGIFVMGAFVGVQGERGNIDSAILFTAGAALSYLGFRMEEQVCQKKNMAPKD